MPLEESLQKYISERTAINQSAFAKKYAIDRINFVKILHGLQRILPT